MKTYIAVFMGGLILAVILGFLNVKATKLRAINLSVSVAILTLLSLFMLVGGLLPASLTIPHWWLLLDGWAGLTVSLEMSLRLYPEQKN